MNDLLKSLIDELDVMGSSSSSSSAWLWPIGVTECTAPRRTNDRMAPTVVSLGLKTLSMPRLSRMGKNWADAREPRLGVLHVFGEKRGLHVALIVVRYGAVEVA